MVDDITDDLVLDWRGLLRFFSSRTSDLFRRRCRNRRQTETEGEKFSNGHGGEHSVRVNRRKSEMEVLIEAGKNPGLRCVMRRHRQRSSFLRKMFHAGALALLLFDSSCAGRKRVELGRFEFTEPQMGAPFRIVLYALDKPAAEAAVRLAFDRIKQLNDILSDYDTDSELSRLSQTAGSGRCVKVSDDLWRVLERSQDLARRTDSAFDVTVGPAVSLWRKARREKKTPDPAQLG